MGLKVRQKLLKLHTQTINFLPMPLQQPPSTHKHALPTHFRHSNKDKQQYDIQTIMTRGTGKKKEMFEITSKIHKELQNVIG
jgi:hypothetical protein